MENCPAKKVVAGKVSEGEVGEDGVGAGRVGGMGKTLGVGRRRNKGDGDSG